MSARDQRLAGSFTIDEAEEIAALADREQRSIAGVIRIAVLELLRRSAETKPAEEVEK